MGNPIINIILTCYYNSNIIDEALSRLSTQTQIDKVIVTLVNDCSPNTNCNYQDLIQKYQNIINFRYLQTNRNSGPGCARQLGLDNSEENWILFHDDDDILYDNYVIERFLSQIEKYPNAIKIIGGLQHINKIENNIIRITSAEDNGSIFGILFNNNLIKKYNIKFNSYLKFDEDVLFNFNYDILTNYEHPVYIYLQEYCYCHLLRENHISITKQSNKRLEHLMQFLISKTYSLKLLLDLNDDNNFETFIDLSFHTYCCFYPILEEIIQKYNNYIDIDTFKLFLQCCDYLNIIFTEFINLFNSLQNKISIKEFQTILDAIDINIIDFSIFSKDYIYYKEQLNNLKNQQTQTQIEINIIIPCYYSSSVIEPCFISLAEQTKKEYIQIILVNDCSPYTDCEYINIIQKYNSVLNIKYLKTPKNIGPGAARQFGLDHIDNNAPYIMFIDDDDKLDNPYVIENYLKILYNQVNRQEKIGLLAGKRVSINGTERKEIGYCGLTGSVFYYPLIELFNITFPNLYFDEDSLFFMSYIIYLNLLNSFLSDFNLSFKLLESDQITAYNYNTNNIISLTHNNELDIKYKAFNLLKLSYQFCTFLNKNFNNYPLINENLYIDLHYQFSNILYYTQYLLNIENLDFNFTDILQYNYYIINTIKKFNCQVNLKIINNIIQNYIKDNNFINFNLQILSLQDYEQYLKNIERQEIP